MPIEKSNCTIPVKSKRLATSFRTIAVVVPKYGLIGGGEKFVLELTERIAACERYHVHVFANQWKKRSDKITFHKVPIITFPKFLTTVSFAWFVKKKMQKINFDLIHTHERIFDADICTLHSVPHFFWVSEIRKKRKSLFDYSTIWVERRFIERGTCKMFLPVSSITEKRFLQEFSISRNNIRTIHPGVDFDRFETLERSQCRCSVRQRYGLSGSDIVMLFVGMNFELKGLDTLIAAISSAKRDNAHKTLKLLVAGKGNEKKYRKISEKFGIAEDVIFAGLVEKNIEELYLASDMFSMLSRFDTFGMTALEAMAASLPVIISNNVGAKDLIKDNYNGFVVDLQEVDAIGKKIGILLNDNVRERMAEEAKKTARENTWDQMAGKVLAVYDQMLGLQSDDSEKENHLKR